MQDEIYENFVENGHFTIGTFHKIPRRLNDLVTWLLWAVVLCPPMFYYVTTIFLSSSLTVKLIAAATVAVGQFHQSVSHLCLIDISHTLLLMSVICLKSLPPLLM